MEVQNTHHYMKKTSDHFMSRRVRHGYMRRRLSTEVISYSRMRIQIYYIEMDNKHK
jgi:hypothetical protein